VTPDRRTAHRPSTRLASLVPLVPLVLLAALATAGAGCGHGGGIVTAALADVDRARTSPGAREGMERAPQEFQHAEDERRLAHQSENEGDGTSASLHAERAMASYQRAFVLARLARATDDLAAAKSSLEVTDEQAHKLAASRADVEREADELDKQLRIAKEAIQPVPSGPADPAREAARLVAARALASEGHLICSAARLLAPSFAGLTDASNSVADLEAMLTHAPRPAPIDAAGRARAACLTLLTRARRDAGTAHAADSDALLDELAATGAWEPSRDERGVVVTLRNAFKGTALEEAAQRKLADLGRVATAHPAFAVQIVLHDASEPTAHEAEADAQRAEAASAAIILGGATKDRLASVLAGARSPLVDPADAHHRARNARLDVVFVAPGN
jgi:flagellar motor protein MotB